jgi:hypothetical protein
MKVKEVKHGKVATLHLRKMEKIGIKIPTHPYEYIKRTLVHHWVD